MRIIKSIFEIIVRIILVALVIVVMALVVVVSVSGPYVEPEEEVFEPEVLPSLNEMIPPGERADALMSVSVLLDGDVVEMPMERYLMGVVAAEMPVSFPLEALKAQAVAARTIILYYMRVEPGTRHPDHPDAIACADNTCCMAYSRDEQLRELWGDDYPGNINRVISAVLGTDGVYITYDGDPILAVFHSSSAGKTEASGNIWAVDLPYLQSVDSPESAAQIPDFISTEKFSYSEFTGIITGAYPDAVFKKDDVESWITDLIYTENGRLSELTAGGVTITSTELRTLFNLRSTTVTVEWLEGEVVFTVCGFGHGVGMSQYGAASMAMDGMTYREILSAYYTGVEFAESYIRQSS